MKSMGEFDVAIVGYGPVGACCALQLADAGLRVLVLERSAELVELPRAIGLDGESMRGFQRLGLSKAVDGILQPRREKDEFCFTDSKRNRLFGIELPASGPNGWRDIAFFDQPELEALLRREVARSDRIAVALGVEVTAIESSRTEVALRGIAAEGEVQAAAEYVIGCDGASSFVRRSIGADWKSLGYDQDWLVIDIALHPGALLPETMMQVCDPARLTTYVPCRDPYRRWEFQLAEGDTRDRMERPEEIEALLDSWLPRSDYDIRRAAVYQFHAATASEWRSGRVMLAGDAAHQTPPFLGQGLNSGLRDAVCLGWKLPLVLSGECDDSLLDSYQEERGAHSVDLVDRAVGIGQLMETLAAREAGLPDPYASAAERAAPSDGQLVPMLRGGTLVAEQIKAGSAVGRLLYQPTVRTDGGSPVRLDEHLGRHFAILARTRADLQLSDEARRQLERLGGRVVSLDELEVVEGRYDPLFEHHPAAVVRPDRYVFGVVDSDHDLEGLMRELANRLHLR